VRLLAIGQLCDEHALQRVDSPANVPVADLLVEHQAEPIAALSILPRGGKRVESGLDAMLLGAEAQTLWQGELWKTNGGQGRVTSRSQVAAINKIHSFEHMARCSR